jgi:O-antigen ligase
LDDRTALRKPDENLQRHWWVTQWGIVLLPINTLLGCIAIVLASLAIWKNHANQLVQNLVNQGLLLLGCWMVIIALFAESRQQSIGGLFNFLPFFIVFIAQSYLIKTPNQLRRLAWLIILPSLIIVLLGMGQLFSGWYFHWKFGSIDGSSGFLLDWEIKKGGEPAGRMASLFYYANVLASYFVTTLTLTLGLFVEAWQTHRSKLTQIGLSIILVANLMGLFWTNSRNGWVLAVAMVVAFATYIGWRWVGALVMGGVIAVLEAAYAPPPLRDWFRTIVPRMIWARINDDLYTDRPIASLRSTQWQFAWDLTQQRPLTGWGLRNFTSLYQAKMDLFMGHPHNLPLMLSAEMGIPATLIFYALVGWVMFSGVQWVRAEKDWRDRTIGLTFVLAFAGCTIFSLFDVTFFDARINTLQWVLLAGIWGVVQRPMTDEHVK